MVILLGPRLVSALVGRWSSPWDTLECRVRATSRLKSISRSLRVEASIFLSVRSLKQSSIVRKDSGRFVAR